MSTMDPPDISGLHLAPRTPPAQLGSALADVATPGVAARDLSLATALAALVHHLTAPLAAHCAHATILGLRASLTTRLAALYAPSWDAAQPERGSGFRTLICTRKLGLPEPLRLAAADGGVDEATWRSAIMAQRKRKAVVSDTLTGAAADDDAARDEWEAWCDPGCVSWRWGPWEYDEPHFDPVRPKEYPKAVWTAGADTAGGVLAAAATPRTHTPARTSHAIPIRAPALLAIPPTPAPGMPPSPASAASLMPAASIARATSPALSDASASSATSSSALGADDSRAARPSHTPTSSTSSFSSHPGQPVTPTHEAFALPVMLDGKADQVDLARAATPATGATRPSTPATVTSASTTAATAPTPTVIPYDGGNVTVVGGGTKLGGGAGAGPSAHHSRASSVISSSRISRSRSPSVSLASRALSDATGPNSNGSGAPGHPLGLRKPRTRRRIHPTYLGPFGQPGVGGPVPAAFGYAPKPIPAYAAAPTAGGAWVAAVPGTGIGMGVAPPPVHGVHMTSQLGMHPQTLGMLRRA